MSWVSVQMAKQLGAAGRIAEDLDKAVTVRPSSSANFYVDSTDKVSSGSAGDFVINKPQSLFNGFFSRIAVNEVVMDWGLPNIAQWWGNNFLTVSVDSGGINADDYTVTLEDGFYTVLEAVASLVTKLNAAPGQTATFSTALSGPNVAISATQPFLISWQQDKGDPGIPAGSAPNYDPAYALSRGLFSSSLLYTGTLPVLTTNPLFDVVAPIVSPLILGTRYVDIVSPQLTYNQDLKDNTTATFQRDVLYRWYLADDNVPVVRENFPQSLDALGTGDGTAGNAPAVQFLAPTNIIIAQGYSAFFLRRAVPVPKQILWTKDQPIGQVSCQSYDDRGRLIDTSKFTPSANYQFQLSMLLSEN